MKLTTKGRFAVTAMTDVSLYEHNGPVCLADIADRQKISLSYLEQLFSKLRRQKLVESVRGPGGGYRLARAREHISVADIVLAVDENLDATQCSGHANCVKDTECLTHLLWTNLNKKLLNYLDSISLDMLVKKTIQPEPNLRKKAGRQKFVSKMKYVG